MRQRTRHLVVGIALLVLGVLVLLGQFTLARLVPVLGVVLIVWGALALAGLFPGGRVVGATLLVLGILLEVGRLGVPRRFVQAADLAVGVILIVMGAARLARR